MYVEGLIEKSHRYHGLRESLERLRLLTPSTRTNGTLGLGEAGPKNPCSWAESASIWTLDLEFEPLRRISDESYIWLTIMHVQQRITHIPVVNCPGQLGTICPNPRSFWSRCL